MMLARTYKKRLKGYPDIGYKLGGGLPEQPPHLIRRPLASWFVLRMQESHGARQSLATR